MKLFVPTVNGDSEMFKRCFMNLAGERLCADESHKVGSLVPRHFEPNGDSVTVYSNQPTTGYRAIVPILAFCTFL